MSAKIAILLSIFFCGAALGCSTSCPPHWTGFEGKCYKFFHGKKNFDQAEAACEQFKMTDCHGNELATAHLASIHNADEQEFLTTLVEENLPDEITGGWDPQAYIGMEVGSTNSEQSWTDGSPVDYGGWVSGEPNNAPYSRGAIAAGQYSKGFWADVYSSNSLTYICQLPCVHYNWQ